MTYRKSQVSERVEKQPLEVLTIVIFRIQSVKLKNATGG